MNEPSNTLAQSKRFDNNCVAHSLKFCSRGMPSPPLFNPEYRPSLTLIGTHCLLKISVQSQARRIGDFEEKRVKRV